MLEGLAEVIDDRVAAVLVEPMMGSAGCIPATPAFLTALRSACDAAGALLIFDEVMTSRMSAGGVQARTGVIPDLTTLGKYLAGGMTFGAFGGRADVMAAFDPPAGGTLTHGGTFNNNVVTMAAGAAGELLSSDALDALFERGEALRSRWRGARPMQAAAVRDGDGVADEHPRGCRAGPKPADSPAPIPCSRSCSTTSSTVASTSPGGYVALSVAIADADCEHFVAALAASVAAIEAGA